MYILAHTEYIFQRAAASKTVFRGHNLCWGNYNPDWLNDKNLNGSGLGGWAREAAISAGGRAGGRGDFQDDGGLAAACLFLERRWNPNSHIQQLVQSNAWSLMRLILCHSGPILGFAAPVYRISIAGAHHKCDGSLCRRQLPLLGRCQRGRGRQRAGYIQAHCVVSRLTRLRGYRIQGGHVRWWREGGQKGWLSASG